MGWKYNIQEKLATVLGVEVVVDNYSYVGGGSINETFKITTNKGPFFVKKNSATRFPGMFEKEATGISLLGDSKEIEVPNIVAVGQGSNDAFLILDFINSGSKSSLFWSKFGAQLASMHKHTTESFGLDHDNYIGSLYQRNKKHNNWCDFFREERLQYQVKMARDSGSVNSSDIQSFERFYKELDSIFPKEPPSLLHGDLWSGNFMVNQDGQPVIIDPAVYYGHREMDLGMTQLFGGFDQQFYESYNYSFPLEKGWKERIQYCNLYPLLVHVNLFGGGYVNSVRSVISRF